jgi:hypothetical protein
MSNARQAIKAARDAGAERVAPEQLSQAQILLEQAEESLQRRDYRNARRNAVEARGRASDAMATVRSTDRKEPG